MEEGKEGDAITFLTLRQIGCSIPESIDSIAQILPELLIYIVYRCLFLISNGEIKV